MNSDKKGTSIISLFLCAVAITLVTTALVVATNNSAKYTLSMMAKNKTSVVETSAYKKTYRINEVRQIARQAFVDNYLSLYDNEVDMSGFEALVIGQMMQTIPQNQLENYNIVITNDSITVEYK